jgi:vancomycin permeability regulator SanA
MLNDRLLQGIALYETGASDRLLMSGDHGRKEYDEVNVMKQYAIDAGVSSEKVFMDHAGFSTYESLYRARDIFGLSEATLVTQRFHLPRALYACKELGVQPVGVAADIQSYPTAINEARELPALLSTLVKRVTNEKPRFLGPKVNVDEPQQR